jgi:Flp pilus assembly pilin Flp
MSEIIARFVRDERATAGVEYALLVSLIALVVIPVATTLGVTLNGTYNSVAGALK